MTNHDKNDIEEMLQPYIMAESSPRLAGFLGSIYMLGVVCVYLGISLVFLLALLGIL
jgi:uncharacterized membrane protein YciS (DUF1049 family)